MAWRQGAHDYLTKPFALAQQVAGSYDFGGPETASEGTGQHVDIGAIDQFATAGIFIETFDARGHPLARSSNLGPRHLPLQTPTGRLVRAAP